MDARVVPLLERIAAAVETIAARLEAAPGPALPAGAPGLPAQLPTFCGHLASWTVDDAGHPSYVLTTDGEIADKHSRQGDVWWSCKDDSAKGGYRRILSIKSGEQIPAEAQWTPPSQARAQVDVVDDTPAEPGPARPAVPAMPAQPAAQEQDAPAAAADDAQPAEQAAQARHRKRAQAEQRTTPAAANFWSDAQTKYTPPKAKTLAERRQAEAEPQGEPPEPANPFSDPVSSEKLQELHALGGAVHGERWREIGPTRVQAHSDGRTTASSGLSDSEATRLINELKLAQQSPEYAG